MRRAGRAGSRRLETSSAVVGTVPTPIAGRTVRPARTDANSWLDRRFAAFAVMPTLLFMLLVFGLPLLFSLYLSTRGWTLDQGIFGGRFVGAENYTDLLTDPHFLWSAGLTCATTAGAVAAELALGLAIALLLNMRLPLIAFFRTALIVPMMMTPIIAALCWKLLLDPKGGIVNWLLNTDMVWLGSPRSALATVTFVNVWQNAPYVAVLLLAGLRALPHEPVEAASIDGAGRWQTFRHVTLPLLMPYITVALLLRTIFEFRAFDNVYVMTSGGPADATMLLSIFTYLTSFVQGDLSYAAAAAWIMTLMALLACAAFILVLRRRGGR